MAHGSLPPTFVRGFHDEAAVRRMRYRHTEPFGPVSVLALGGSALGAGKCGLGGLASGSDQGGEVGEDPWFARDSEADIAHVRELVGAALRAGVNLIDTAHWYGQGRGERLLGLALQGVPHSAYFVCSKVGRYAKEPTRMLDFSYAKTYQAGIDTLTRLRLQCVDCLSVHDPEFAPDLDLVLAEALPALQRLKEEGRTRRIGITGYPLSVQRELLVRSRVRIDTALSYCHYSLHDTSLLDSGFDRECVAKGATLISASPLAMGLLAGGDGGVPEWHPATAEARVACAAAAEHCAQQGASIARLAVHFSLADERIAATYCGALTLEQLRANLAAATEPLTEREAAALRHVRATFFGGEAPYSWEGVEIAAYRQAVPVGSARTATQTRDTVRAAM